MKRFSALISTLLAFSVAIPSPAKAEPKPLSEFLPLGTYYRRDGKESITLTDTTTETCNRNGCKTRQVVSMELGLYWLQFDDDRSQANGYFRYEPRRGVLEYLFPRSSRRLEYLPPRN